MAALHLRILSAGRRDVIWIVSSSMPAKSKIVAASNVLSWAIGTPIRAHMRMKDERLAEHCV